MGRVINLRPLTEASDEAFRSVLANLEIEVTQLDNLEKRVLVIEEVQRHWPKWSEVRQQLVLDALVRALQLPGGARQFLFLLDLGRRDQLRRALTHRPVRQPMEWLPSEKVYPDDDTWLGRFLRWSSHSEVHRGFFYWSGVACLAAAMRRHYYFASSGVPMHPHQYIILAAPSGVGKNHAIDSTIAVLKAAKERIESKFERTEDGYKVPPTVPTLHILEGYMTAQKLVDKLVSPPVRRDLGIRHIASDRQAPQLQESCALLAVPEMARLLGKGTHAADTTVVTLTDIWDGQTKEHTLSRGDKETEELSLTCLFGSTIEWIKGQMPDNVFSGGFMGRRALLIYKEDTGRRFSLVPHRDEQAFYDLARETAEIVAHRNEEGHPMPSIPVEFEDEAAFKLYDEFYREKDSIMPHADERVGSYIYRREIHLQKLMLVHAVSRGEVPFVTKKNVELSIRILENEQPGMFEAFRQITSPKERTHAQRLRDFLLRSGGKAPIRLLWQNLRFGMSRKDYIEALDHLLEAGEIVRWTPPGTQQQWVKWTGQGIKKLDTELDREES